MSDTGESQWLLPASRLCIGLASADHFLSGPMIPLFSTFILAGMPGSNSKAQRTTTSVCVRGMKTESNFWTHDGPINLRPALREVRVPRSHGARSRRHQLLLTADMLNSLEISFLVYSQTSVNFLPLILNRSRSVVFKCSSTNCFID